MRIIKDKLTVRGFVEDKKKELKLSIIGGKEGFNKEIKVNLITCPGLLLSGYKKHFVANAIQILGLMEMNFLSMMDKVERKRAIQSLLSYNIPCIIVTDNLNIPDFLNKLCREKKIPLISTKMKQCDFVHKVLDFIEMKTAPYIYCHATLVDVYGVGILFTGKSGIGKSETALDLVARGHRLVADDVIKITRRNPGILMGQGKEPIDFFHSHIEIRGIGVIDLSRVFGVRATRLHKRVEVEVNLVKWGKKANVERTGLEEKTKTILGVKIPYKIIPLVLGKNVSVLSEMVALEHLLKLYAHNTPVIFNRRLIELMKRKGKEFAQLEKDFE